MESSATSKLFSTVNQTHTICEWCDRTASLLTRALQILNTSPNDENVRGQCFRVEMQYRIKKCKYLNDLGLVYSLQLTTAIANLRSKPNREFSGSETFRVSYWGSFCKACLDELGVVKDGVLINSLQAGRPF